MAQCGALIYFDDNVDDDEDEQDEDMKLILAARDSLI